MFSADTADRWHWSADLHEGVNFCVWVLLRDGLRVPPFDRHAAGDGQLQAAGLEPDAWRAWLVAVVGLDARLRQTLPWPSGRRRSYRSSTPIRRPSGHGSRRLVHD